MHCFYRNPQSQWPRYEQDIKEEFPQWEKGEDLPDGWVSIVEPDGFALPEPVVTATEEGDGELLPANIKWATKFKAYELEIWLNNETNMWTIRAVLNETEIDLEQPLPVEWLINGEWTADAAVANEHYELQA